ncbi:hypothetical protein ACIQXD_24220 [Streptomyces uncialis]|uniref:hypothetical protein n=1 Tax=Streptomyces uncialis TaxID=1048205 RepID=UPI0038043785
MSARAPSGHRSPSGSSRGSGRAVLTWLGRSAMGLVALVLLVAGVWGSWGSAQHVLFTKGRERGEMTVSRCGGEECVGAFTPLSPGARARERVVLDQSVGAGAGDRLAVVVKPDTDEVVRAGIPGLVRSWVPLGGALLLAAVVLAGGVRLWRTAWATAAAGLLLLAAAVVTV